MRQFIGREYPLLITKLQVPPLRSDLVARPELIERLDGGLRRRLTLISAPAGSGKSTLLSAWVAAHAPTLEEHNGVLVAWLSLEKSDNDLVRFWRYLIAAIEMAQSDVLSGAAVLLPRLHQEPGAALTGLINMLFAGSYEFALVLDDYHLIEDQDIHDTVAFLLDHLPPNVHIFIASRVDPPLLLARLRARGQLLELRGPELRFTLSEMNAFLYHATGRTLSESEIAALDERVEGWVAGLQLMALSLRGRDDITAFLASFSGNHRHIVDYLAGEVLDHLPADLHSFLLQTSVLERLCAALCDAVTGRTDGQSMLEQLELRNLFVIPLDDERVWYRYHHLFADVLRKRLQVRFPARTAQLHRLAASWLEQAGQPAGAVEHALAARDFPLAARLMEHAYGRMIARGEVITLMHWLDALPADLVQSSLKLLMGRLWALVGLGRWEEAERCLQDVESRADEVSQQHSLMGNLFVARASLQSGRGDTFQAASLLQQALAHTPGDSLMQRSYILLNLAFVHWANNDLELMRQTLVEAWQAGRGGGHSYVALAALSSLARLQYAYGSLVEARSYFQQALRYIEEVATSDSAEPVVPGATFTYQGMGALLYEMNDLAGARHHFEECARLMRLSYDSRMDPALHLEQARLQLALGNLEEVRVHLRALENFLALEPVVVYQQAEINVFLIQLYLSLDEHEQAAAWLRDRYLPELSRYPFISIHGPAHQLAARVYLEQGAYRTSLEVLCRLAESAEAERRDGSLISILTLRALALSALDEREQAVDEREQAVESLERALSLGEQGGYLRTFVDEGARLAPLLADALTRRQKRSQPGQYRCSPEYVRRLLHLLGASDVPLLQQASHLDGQQPPELLSPRELEVLRLISQGLSNQEITEHLVIAASTLKTHINHIYSKLDARDRVQAVMRARSLGMLP